MELLERIDYQRDALFGLVEYTQCEEFLLLPRLKADGIRAEITRMKTVINNLRTQFLNA